MIAAAGYIWSRCGQPFDNSFVAAFVTTFGTPCLVVNTLTTVGIDLATVGTMAGAIAAVIAITLAVGAGLLLLFRQSLLAFLPAVAFPNGGNMGLPLCLFAFGEKGLGLAVACFAVLAAVQYTVTPALALGSLQLGRLLRQPMLWAVPVALVLMATDTRLPLWLARSVDLVSGVVIPLMVFALGVSLASLPVRNLGPSVGRALMRLVPGLAIGVVVAEAFGLEGAERGVLIIQSAMPSAVFCYIFAARYNRQPADVAALVVVSTVLGFLALPLIMLVAIG